MVLLSLPWYYSVSTLGDTISVSRAFPATVDCILKLWTKSNHFPFLLEYFITTTEKNIKPPSYYKVENPIRPSNAYDRI